jgi:putative transposase
VAVRQPRVRDRGAPDGERIRFSRRCCRATPGGPGALLPVLYLRGVSTGDMQEALAALLGKDARNLSPAVLARLKSG